MLAALGPVLCQYPAGDSDPLRGFQRAATVCLDVGIEADRPHEALYFRDPQGLCCGRLSRLPDSDFLAWERLQARLPVAAQAQSALERAATAFWFGRRLRRGWRFCPLRLHVLRLKAAGRSGHDSLQRCAADPDVSADGCERYLAANRVPVSQPGARVIASLGHAADDLSDGQA